MILYTRSLLLSLFFLLNLKSKYQGCLNSISSWNKGYLLQKLDNCKWFLMDPHLKYICLWSWKDLIFISTIVLNSTYIDNKSSRNLAIFVFLGSHNSNRNRGAPKQQSLILLELNQCCKQQSLILPRLYILVRPTSPMYMVIPCSVVEVSHTPPK